MATQKPRLLVTLDSFERQKLEKLAASRGLSLSRMIGQLIREADLPKAKQELSI